MTNIVTKQAMIREHAAVLLALFDSKKADGTPYPYAEMLTLVGLSSTHDWVRALSKFFTANGKRRKAEYTWKRDEIPAAETLPGVLEEPQPETFVDTDMLRDIHRKIYDCMTALCDSWKAMEKAIQELNVEWYRMIGAVGIKPEDANE